MIFFGKCAVVLLNGDLLSSNDSVALVEITDGKIKA